jgi:hypothetical protein
MRQKKNTQRTRRDQYAEILLDMGFRPESCCTLCIVFGDEETARRFHYDEMVAPWYEHILIFDVAGTTARLVFQRETPIREDIIELAKACGPCTVFDE